MVDKQSVLKLPADWESRLPPDTWDGREYTLIHATVLFADLQNSVLISSTLPPPEYDRLVDDFQTAMNDLIQQLRDDTKNEFPIGECQVVGDQLSIFFFEPEEVYRNFLLDGPDRLEGAERKQFVRECLARNENVVYRALQAAIFLKNLWLVREFNLSRVLHNRSPYNLGIGIHTGNVYLRNRADGSRRIEGYTVNYAKRVEGFSRHGKFSQIMLSHEASNIIRGSVRSHTQLRQRIFFHRHEVPLELLKGILSEQQVYELKFFHRIGIHLSKGVLDQYKALFAADRTNIWAYYQLVDHIAYQKKEWDKAFRLAKNAYLVYPDDEKVLLDLAGYYLHCQNLGLAQEYCERAIQLNTNFDLAFEVLAEIAFARGDLEGQVQATRMAVTLSPGSAANHLNHGISLLETNRPVEGTFHIKEAFRIYPQYMSSDKIIAALANFQRGGLLPDDLQVYLEQPSEQC